MLRVVKALSFRQATQPAHEQAREAVRLAVSRPPSGVHEKKGESRCRDPSTRASNAHCRRRKRTSCDGAVRGDQSDDEQPKSQEQADNHVDRLRGADVPLPHPSIVEIAGEPRGRPSAGCQAHDGNEP